MPTLPWRGLRRHDFQTKAILDATSKDSGLTLAELVAVDGDMSNSDLCMQVGR